MAKAIIGAVEIGVGVGLLVMQPELAPLSWGLIMSGAGMEVAYVAEMLQGNPALTASAKLPAAPREFVVGMVRKGCTFIYQSTTGHQLNEVPIWAANACQAIVAVYVDQRKLYYIDNPTADGSPYGGGVGDGNTYQDDSGNNYSFGSETAAWHTLGQLWSSGAWSAGMTATRVQLATGDTASTFAATTIGVTINGTVFVFGCLVPGTAGSSSSVFSGAAAAGTQVTDGGILWVNLGPAPGGYWFSALNGQDTSQWLNNCLCVNLCASYLKFTYDANVFSGPPQLRATIMGANDVYDPRTSTYGYSTNSALVCAWLIVNPEVGFGATPGTPKAAALWAGVYEGIFGDQLIAAANLCDEQVQLTVGSVAGSPTPAPPWQPFGNYNIGDHFNYGSDIFVVNTAYVSGAYFGEDDGTHITEIIGSGLNPSTYESRYTCNGYFNSDQEPGQILSSMLMSCEGRIVRQGGGYLIYPAAWYGTSLNFGADDLCGAVKWSPSRKFRDRVNCMRGTFICPQYPYNQVGYSYDYKNGGVFNGEWQPTDIPPYAQDYLHGYGLITDPGQGDANLVQDGGVRLYGDRHYQFVISVAQAQRLLKIYMLRNRFAGSGTFPMKLSALQAQSQDVMNFTFAPLNMVDAYLEISKFDWVLAEGDDAGEGDAPRAMRLTTQIELQLTDPSVYEWTAAEEMTLYDQPSPALNNPFAVSAPASLTAISNLSTALVSPDGTVTPRIELTWTESADPFVTSGGDVQVQISPHSAGAWADVATLNGTAAFIYIGNVVTGNAYDLQVRFRRGSGAYSAWSQLINVVCGFVVNATGLNAVAPAGTLSAVTTSATVSVILIGNFTGTAAGVSGSFVPSPTDITALTPQTLYYVYFIESAFATGTITPIATTNINDFLNVPGYWLIGSILTPPWTGAGSYYAPSNYNDLGPFQTNSPTYAYDGNFATRASITSNAYSGSSFGECLYEDFPAVTVGAGKQLNVNAAVSVPGGPALWAITACIGGGSKPQGVELQAFNARGAWAATTAYAVWDTFTESGITYLVVSAYTSGGTFGSTDIAATCVVLASGNASAAQTTYAVTVPTGTLISGITVDVALNAPASIGAFVYAYEIWIQ
jgi:hypothetical protein